MDIINIVHTGCQTEYTFKIDIKDEYDLSNRSTLKTGWNCSAITWVWYT